MKTQIWVYIVVAVLSVGVGVALAGLPSSTPREPTIVAPTTIETTVPIVVEEPMFEPVAAEDSNDDPDAASGDDADAAAGTGSDDVVETTTTTTSTTTTTTTTTVPLAERDVFPVAVANGAGGPGVASAGADQLIALGYAGVRALDGAEIVEFTTVYYGPDLELFAQRLATDLGLTEDQVGELAGAPEVPSLRDEPLLVYLGQDALDV